MCSVLQCSIGPSLKAWSLYSRSRVIDASSQALTRSKVAPNRCVVSEMNFRQFIYQFIRKKDLVIKRALHIQIVYEISVTNKVLNLTFIILFFTYPDLLHAVRWIGFVHTCMCQTSITK